MKNPSLRTIGYLIGAICLIVAARSLYSWNSQQPLPFKSSPQLQSVVDGNTAFALDFYRQLKDQPGNLFFSPHSISTCLAMTYVGARAQTESEMASVLHFNAPQSDVHAAFAKLTDRLDSVQRGGRIKLNTANALWCQRNYKFAESFVDLVRRRYHADAMRVDFSDPDAGREINAWVKRKTSGKIEHIIDPSALNNGTALVLCNAIYFKGKWTTEFNPKKTEPAPFHISTNASDTVTVPMMQQQSDCKMISADDVVELIELPYSGRDLSMIILLPQDVGGLDGLEQMLTTDNLRTWLQRLDGARPEKTSVLLPRFKFTREFDLVNSLKALGMRSLFNVHDANLSGMDPTDNLFVSDAVHKALVEVNEEGTEAAAATRVTVKMRGMNHNRSFTADHPFIFLIRERGSGSILFLGRLVRPQPA